MWQTFAIPFSTIKHHLYWLKLSTIKVGSKCLDLLDKPKVPGYCGFPLANTHFGESGDFVPQSNLLK
jgi:hypothetical protein